MNLIGADLMFARGDETWQRIKDRADACGMKGGIYRVHAGSRIEIAGRVLEGFAPVPRLLGTDPDGILYIGKATDFLDRFIARTRGLGEGKDQTHGFAKAYRQHAPTVAAFPIENLRFTLRFAVNPREAEIEECGAYRQRFGEFPPFNSNY